MPTDAVEHQQSVQYRARVDCYNSERSLRIRTSQKIQLIDREEPRSTHTNYTHKTNLKFYQAWKPINDF